jgi:hypothetical protein
MKIFAVLFESKSDAGELAIKKIYPNDHIKISELSWLVSDNGTSKEISDKLGFSEGKLGSNVVLSTNGYFGWASNSIWEWAKAKTEAS